MDFAENHGTGNEAALSGIVCYSVLSTAQEYIPVSLTGNPG